MVVRQHAEMDVHFMDVPWQHVKPLARGIFTRARYKYASGIRTTLRNTSELDPAMFIEVVQKRPREERTIFEYVATLSMWTNEKKEGIGQAATTKCLHCNEEYQDSTHTIWDCPVLLAASPKLDQELVDLVSNSSTFNAALKHGLPPMMGAQFSTTFWGEDLGNYTQPQRAIIGEAHKRHTTPSAEVISAVNGVVNGFLQTTTLPSARQALQNLRGGIQSCSLFSATPSDLPPQRAQCLH